MSRFRGPARLVATVLVATGLAVAGAGPAAADRTVGAGPLDAIVAAAEDYHDDCATAANRLTVGELVALAVAPTIPETGAPPSQAPSPMTLSRYDDQSGLHSFGDPSTLRRAFWHPGIGAWQWDDASLRGFSASERIDSGHIAEFTTAYLAQRWCSDPSFASVWGPWYGCNGGVCKGIYDELVDSQGQLRAVVADAAVRRRGGMAEHECSLGATETFTCWYVDPGRAQGYTGFAVSGFGPAPVTAPFLGFQTDTREHRHWLRGDTGYDVDVQASLPRGRNSRTDLAWETGSDLCDVTRVVGRCDPRPPPGADLDVLEVNGTYTPLAGDFDGDGFDDVFWYAPGRATDWIWWGRSDGHDIGRVSVGGRYDPLVGDFDGDGSDDVFWYGPGRDPDNLWWGGAAGFEPAATNVGGVYRPVAGDFDGDGFDDVLWYGPGATTDSVWPGRPTRRFARAVVEVGGTYTPVAGDFDGDGNADVFWYGRGNISDSTWYGRDRAGSFAPAAASVGGVYEPVAGDLDGDGRDDLLWYAAGTANDWLWWGRDRSFAVQQPPPQVTGNFRPVTGDFHGSGSDEFLFHRPGRSYDGAWRWRG